MDALQYQRELAELLARRDETPPPMRLKLRVGEDIVGVDGAVVARIEEHMPVTPIPGAVPWFQGLAASGATAIAVVDLERLLCDRPAPPDAHHVILRGVPLALKARLHFGHEAPMRDIDVGELLADARLGNLVGPPPRPRLS